MAVHAILNNRCFRSLKFNFNSLKKFITLDVLTSATLKGVMKILEKNLNQNFSSKKIVFVSQKKELDQNDSFNKILNELNERKDSNVLLEIDVLVE